MDSEEGFQDLGILGVTASQPRNVTSDDSDQFPDLSLFPEGGFTYRPLRNPGVQSVLLKQGDSLPASEAVSTAAEIIEEVQGELRDALLSSLTHSDTGTAEVTRAGNRPTTTSGTHSGSHQQDNNMQAQPDTSLSAQQGSAPALLRARLLQGVHGHLHAVDEEEDARLGDLPSLLSALGLSSLHSPDTTALMSSSPSDIQQRPELSSEQNQEQGLEQHIAGSARDASGLCPIHHLPNPSSREESEAQVLDAEAARRTLPNTEGLQDGVQRALEAVLAEIQGSI